MRAHIGTKQRASQRSSPTPRRQPRFPDYPYPLGASYSILSYVHLYQGRTLCHAPFRAVPLICPNCAEPHDVGLAYVRTDREDIPPWALYFAGAMGAA